MFDYFWFFITDRNVQQRRIKYSLLSLARSGNVKAMGDLAKLCRLSGDTTTAVKWYNNIISTNGVNAKNAANNLGNIYYGQRRYDQALKFYEQAANQGLTVAKKNIGIIYQEQEHWDAAISWFKVAAYEGDSVAKERLAKLLLRPSNSPVNSWQEAERLAQRWMFYFGFHDAQVTPAGTDGGIDVNSVRAIAQVKYERSTTGRPELQKLAGVAHDEDKAPLFFSLSGYTKNALAWAEQSRIGIALFKYDYSGNVIGLNGTAKKMLSAAKNQ